MPLDPHDHLLQSLLASPAFRSWAEGKRPGDDAIWEKWAAEHDDGAAIVREAIAIASAMPIGDEHLTDDYIHHKVNEALQAARRQEQQQENRKRDSFFPVFISGWNVAASLLIVAGLCFAIFRIYQNNKRVSLVSTTETLATNTLREVTNTERSFKYVQLPDGSSVVLHRNSTLKYPQTFTGKKREVYLTGEAFFEVTKDRDQPFFVYAGELITKVHGTSFSIKAIANEAEITVAVKTGKVSVSSENASPTLLLTCNQQATFERAHAKLVRSALKSPVLLNIPIENQEFTYSETPAADVFEALGKAYGVTVAFDRHSLAHCSITATLGDEPLENKLKWLCTILEAKYTINQDSITITGNPCN
ncbi:FecR family protein [Dyadobacter sp. CY261]|uniref:FecR family protein n=1 Tax=Dyadobacter sp. CY261 TaxID=2907203 RepID=UPI001F291AB7|nr:FecR family protein [Dyadobacter sp. CY261]MCF0070546.1 FecR family protein [Dyadobacter sp. CY261]